MDILPYWKIALEVVILWYAFYMVLLFFKGTRSEQLLKGLVILSIVFLISQQMQLGVINWVMTQLFPISIIALVIIFQPELRRGLAQLGQFGLRQESIEVIEEVSGAATSLASRKMGALIVIEREMGLKSYIESGTPIDARVTSYLLTSIFLPQSPLHDGAVIIQQGRLVAAGCVLPLPQEEGGVTVVPRSLGMRHRAAVGISEETDAVSVVVSEETGALSVASGGKLMHNLDHEALVRMLKETFYKPQKKRPAFTVRGLFKGPKGKED
jgi:diadenylate cyclase